MKKSSKILLSIVVGIYSISSSAQNLVNMNDWVSGTNGVTDNFYLQGTASQNSRITMAGPYGDLVTVWEASADGSSGMNGGFEHKGIVVDTDKTYRVSFWVRSAGSNGCTNYTGFTPYYTGGGLVQPFENESGGSTSWPYFSSKDQPNDKWFLVIGYVRSASATDLGDSGVYDPSTGTTSNLPSPTYAATDFIFPSSVSQIAMRIRTFMWACGAGEKMFIYDPRLEEVPNMAPISTLLYGTSSADTQAPTSPTLSSTTQTDTTVDLSWAGATDNTTVTGYKIFKDGVLEATLGIITSYQVTGLAAATAYAFTSKALDAAGNESNASNVISITTNSSGGSSSGSTVWSESNSVASYSGTVAVGTNTVPSGYKMAVDGKLITEEVKVQLSGSWPDYVFNKGYGLPTLEEVEKHITEKGHLPNIPSAKEVEANGIELGEMNKLLLEKIEELMLYVLAQEKRIVFAEEKNEFLENRIKTVEDKLSKE